MQATRREARYIPTVVATDEGQDIVELKCWVYFIGGRALHFFWELCRLVEVASLKSPSERLHSFIARMAQQWREAWQLVGLEAEAVFKESERAARERSRREQSDLQADDHRRTEWSMDTVAALCVLVTCIAVGPKKRRASAELLLKSWLLAAMPVASIASELQAAMSGEALALCPSASASHCVHLRDAFPSWPHAADTDIRALPTCFRKLYLASDVCPSARQVLTALLHQLGAKINEAVTEKGHQRTLASKDRDPCRHKRRRIDEDAAAKVIEQSRAEHMSAGTYVTTHGVGTARSTTAWDAKEACMALSAAWLTFATSRVVSVSLDGKRLGNPAQECEAYAALDPGSGVAAWLPIQAAWEP
jgi:hypothetical protein